MKRVCFFAVIFVLLFNIFNPVTTSSAVPNPATTITIWHQWWDPNLTNIQGILDQYHAAHPEVNFSLYRPGNMNQELAAAIPNVTGPDVIAGASNTITDFEMSNYIIDLDQLGVTATFLNSTYEPAAVAGVTYNGKLWALPDTQEAIALVYNKALVNASDLPTDPLNFTALYNKALAFKTATHKPLICNQGFPGGDAYHIAPVFFGFGVPSYVDDAGNVYANTPAAINAGTWLSSMPALTPATQSQDDCASQFFAGEVGMWWTGPWAMADIVSHGIDFGIVPMGKPFVGIRALMISSNAQNRGNAAAALEVMKYLTNYGNSKALSLLNMTIPANTQAFQDPAVQALPTIAGFSAATSIGVLMSPSPYSSCQWGPMGDAERRIWSGSHTPTAALNIAQDEIRNCVLRIIGHVDLGQPGTSFRYVQMLGTTEVPYLADSEHLNHPEGLFIDSSDNLFVVESGDRLLKFDSNGTFQWSIGKAGVNYTDNYVFGNPTDATLDGAGNVWVADANRVVKYDPNGVFLEQLPANDPWNGGSDNQHFNWAHGVAVDQQNHLFVSDTWNHRVQVYDISSGSPVYSATIGENGVAGDDNAHFNQPWRIAVDGNNTLYVVDWGNNRVQRCTFDSEWTCSMLTSLLNNPQGITVDSSNNVYIADTGSGRIIKCPAGGSCLLLNSYGFQDLAVDSSGNIYGADGYNALVMRFNSAGQQPANFLGVPQTPYLTDTKHFNLPRVAVDANDNLIVIEGNGQRLSKYDAQGAWQWSIGTPGFNFPDNSHFQYPRGAATDASGNIYVADGNRVQIFSGAGDYLDTIGWKMGGSNFQFGWVTGVAVDQANGKIYVADGGNQYQTVQVFDSNRQYLVTLGETGVSASDNYHFYNPMGLEVDQAGNLYVADSGNCRVQKYNSSLVYQMTFGLTGSCSNRFSDVGGPEDVTVDAQGRVYIADNWNNRVEVFDSTGAYLTTIGGYWGTLTSQFRGPSGVAVDSRGNVYVSDYNCARIQKFTLGVPGWRQSNINGFGSPNPKMASLEPFKGQLYAATVNFIDYSTQIFRTADGKTWEAVTQLGAGIGAGHPAIIDMIEFGGMLYAGAGWGVTSEIWRTSNGTDWAPVLTGLGGSFAGIETLGVFKSQIYAAISDFSGTGGVAIYRSSTGDPESWEPVVTGGNGDARNVLISGFQEFKNSFYAVGKNSVTGAMIWQLSEDGNAWVQVNASGFGSAQQAEAISIASFNDNLYVGTCSVSQCELATGQIWKSSDGANWSPLVTDGFGDSNNGDVTALYVFQNTLYAVVRNTTTGIQVWKTYNGTNWLPVNLDGLGDANNTWTLRIHGITNFKNMLYVATLNDANGTEVWQMLGTTYIPMLKKN